MVSRFKLLLAEPFCFKDFTLTCKSKKNVSYQLTGGQEI